MSFTTLALLILGLILLVAGAELLVRGAARLALRFGISPLVIGLTVVAFGTSAPELAVSVQAGLAGQTGIAVGNIVGSNIFNVLVVLGLAALITPLVISQQLIRIDIPLTLGISVLFLLMAYDGSIGIFDGLLLTAGIIAYTVFAIQQSRSESAAIEAEYEQEFGGNNNSLMINLPIQIALIVAGLALLVLGAHWLVESAVSIARTLGVSEVVIGLTIIAAGTSLPELATSIVAALRGERDIAVGNVIGSCLFNLLSIAGIAALVTPGGLDVSPSLITFDIPVMIGVVLACVTLAATGHVITRWQGALLFSYYLAYILYLVLDATQSPLLGSYSNIMLSVAMPLTLIALTLLLVRYRSETEQASQD